MGVWLMHTHLNFLNQDPFSAVTMSTVINDTEYKPNFLQGLGLCRERPLTTQFATLVRKGKTLKVIKTSPRGAPDVQDQIDPRSMIQVPTFRIAKKDRITASEIQDVLRFSEDQVALMEIMGLIAEKQNELNDDVSFTMEHMQLGMVQGIMADADGATLIDAYSTFGITKPSAVHFDLDATDPAEAAILKKLENLNIQVQLASKGKWLQDTYLCGIAGKDFYQKIRHSAEVRETFKGTKEAPELRKGGGFSEFWYGDTRIVHYRGSDDASSIKIPDDECRFFPVNAKEGTYEKFLAPAERLELANKKGQERYSWLVRDPQDDAWVDVKVRSYPAYLCTQPDMLVTGKAGAAP